MRLIAEMTSAELNYHYVDFWPLVKSVRIAYAAACYALFWSFVALPVALVMGYGLTSRDLPGTFVLDLHGNWRMLVVWLACYLIGFVVALPHLAWMALLERRDPSDRVGFMIRSIKVGLVYGIAQGLGVWLFVGLHVGHLLRVWPLAIAFYLVAFVCGYIAGRVEAKVVPNEVSQIGISGYRSPGWL